MSTPVGAISVVGEVVEADAEWWSVRRRDGSIALVEVSRIEARRDVPPGRSATTSVAEVQQIAAFGWRAQETVRLGEWLLRASGGFTQRANSALAVGDPGMPIGDALDLVTAWYADRGLPANVMVTAAASPPRLAEQLAERGWAPGVVVHLMTGEVAHALRAMPDAVAAASGGLELCFDDRPDDSWYSCYSASAHPVTAPGKAVMETHPAVVFASLRDAGRAVAVARAAVDARWTGIFAVAVSQERRRQGLGAAITLAALKEAARRGGRHVYLQVAADNAPAIELYRRLNLRVHHDYSYWLATASEQSC